MFSAVEAIYGEVWIAIVFGAVYACLIVLNVIFKRSKWYVSVICALCLVVGLCSVYVVLFASQGREIVCEKVTVVGRVTDIGRNGNSKNTVYLEDCTTDKYRIPGRVEMYVYDGSLYNTGDVVTVDGTLRSKYIFKSYVDSMSLRNKVYYNLQPDNVLVASGELRLDETIRKYIYDVAVSNASQRTSGVLYALLTGDRNCIDVYVKDLFENVGIVHLLAVSGLHVGVVAAVVAFFVSKLRLHPMAELAVVFVPLLFYAYLCGFGPSVVRAVAMMVCVYLSRALFGKVDLLTSLSWAGILLLLVNPLYLYDAGFQLSFLSVYGIATLYTALSRRVKRLRIPRFCRGVVDSVVLSLSCTLSTMPCLLYVYGRATFVGIVANLFAIPLVSAAFVLALAGLIPFVGKYFVIVADYLVRGTVAVAEVTSGVDVSLSVTVLGLSVVLVVVWLFVSCGFVNLRLRGKIVTNCVFAVMLGLSVLFASLPKPNCDVAYVSVGYDNPVVSVLSEDGQAAVVTNFNKKNSYNLAEVNNILFRHDVKSVYWVVTDFASCEESIVSECVSSERGDKVFVADSSDNGMVERSLAKKGVALVRCFKNTSIGNGVMVTAVYDGDLRAVVLDSGKLKIATVLGSDVAVSNFGYMRSDIDVYVMKNAFQSYGAQLKTSLSLYQTEINCNLGANKYGNFTIRPKDGTIQVSFR